MASSIQMMKVQVAMVSLTEAREIHTVRIRIYKDMLDDSQGQERIEEELAYAASLVFTKLYTDFNLDESIGDIDIGGWYHSPLSAEWGYVEIAKKLFRIVDIDINIIVDSTDIFDDLGI